jgi:multicomponent Na+:H+ antiporter subunit E
MNSSGFVSLVVLWLALAGPTPGHLVLGVVIALLVLFLSGMTRAKNPEPRPLAWLLVGLRFSRELVQSNIEVALHVMRPRMRFRPGILRIPLEPMSDAQITMLANMLTLTPGTAVLDISQNNSHLIVHVLDIPDPERTIRSIKEGLERRILETRS